MTPTAATASIPSPQADLGPLHNGRATLRIAGAWQIEGKLPEIDSIAERLESESSLKSLDFESGDLRAWDSGLVSYLTSLIDRCQSRGIAVDQAGLPEGIRGLLRLAYAVPERKGARRSAKSVSFVQQVGEQTLALTRSSGEIAAFLGEVVLAFWRLIAGQARFRKADLWLTIQEAGADSLPIVSLVTFLVGLILGFIAEAQLAAFGAKIYVADLVGLAMVIQLGAVITAIVLAGRTGAAFAAQLGTMQVNEEIDALRTLGIAPMDFLVLPRLLALILMTPLLAIYADLMGILGGAFVANIGGGITLTEYFVETQQAIGWSQIIQGLISATVYGAIVAVSGCLRGMQCGRSASSVGLATTSAVVTAIVFIVIAASVLTIIFNALGL
jgi:phospholipid/cholesterol/gamma-HCH transport system permease protein